MLISHAEYVKVGFRDEASFEQHFLTETEEVEDAEEAKVVDPVVRDIWDFSRIMTARVTWSPYMHSRRLPHLLGDVQTPTLLVWGEHDRVVPVDCARQYERALPDTRLEIVADAGHAVDMEQPEVLAGLIAGHAGVGGNVA